MKSINSEKYIIRVKIVLSTFLRTVLYHILETYFVCILLDLDLHPGCVLEKADGN
jgi:hypothetical protein